MHGLLSLSYSALAAFCVVASIGKTFAAPNPQPRGTNDWLYTAALPPPSQGGGYVADYTNFDAYYEGHVQDLMMVLENGFEILISTGNSATNASEYFPDTGVMGEPIISNNGDIFVTITTLPISPFPGFREWFSEATTDGIIDTAQRFAGYAQQNMDSANSIELCLELVYVQDAWGIALLQGGWGGIPYGDNPSSVQAKLKACLNTFNLS